jgi:RNA-directed DNA polymerase
MRQKILEMASGATRKGETRNEAGRGSEMSTAESLPESPASNELLMEEICDRENLKKALKRVKQNKGSPGIDGMRVEQLPGHLKDHWPRIREQLLNGTYTPLPVKRVEIPKPGGGVRKLGVPCSLDRFVQQAVLQVLQEEWDPTFSERSYGFRPGRSAHQAVGQAQQYISEGYRYVVDMDLEKFFDRVNHDILMSRVADRVSDKRLLRLIRAFLNAGVMENGLISSTEEGTPQGGPLSPLLSNLLLDDLDRELTRRGHRFVRYADDCNIYVRSERAGRRVMASISHFLTTHLKLKINEQKSAVGKPSERKFLGFSFTDHAQPKRRIAPLSLERFKRRVRELTRRTRRVSIDAVAEQLRCYLTGWRGYFGYCETSSVLRDLDSWIRHRLRSLIWKQWPTGRTRFKELRLRGISPRLAAQTASSGLGPWRIGRSPAMHVAFPNAFFNQLGLPQLAARINA